MQNLHSKTQPCSSLPAVGGFIQVETMLVGSLGECLQLLLPNLGQLQPHRTLLLLMGSNGHCPGISRRGAMLTAQHARMLKQVALPHHQPL